MNKTIIYKGETYNVPKWVSWVATDRDGRIYGYEEKPVLEPDGKWGVDRSEYEMIFIGYDYWEDYLVEV